MGVIVKYDPRMATAVPLESGTLPRSLFRAFKRFSVRDTPDDAAAYRGSCGMNNFSERTEMLRPEPAEALGALLGVPVPDLAGGAGLPLLWHWAYLLDRPAQADLGPDGHSLSGTDGRVPRTRPP